MSYLNPLRLHFAGQFQASVSTVNNDPVHFDNARFKPEYQDRQTTANDLKGWFNPRGDATWRLLGCTVTGAWAAPGVAVPQSDPVWTYIVADSDRNVAAKLVDLDPEQQLVSTVFGLEVRVATAAGATVLQGRFEPTAFTDIWTRTDSPTPGDTDAGACYQSVLTDLEWGDITTSPFLTQLYEAAMGGMLSIKFNVDSFNLRFTSPDFMRGRVTGTIGPAAWDEPHHLVLGRHFLTTSKPTGGFFDPVGGVNFCVARVDPVLKKVFLDLGNALPTSQSGAIEDLGPITLAAVVQTSQGPKARRIDTIAAATYTDATWYPTTAGVVELPAARQLTDAELQAIAANPLAIATAPQGTASLAISEPAGGEYVRADSFVYRMSPNERVEARLYATRFGQAYAGARIVVLFDPSQLQPGSPLGPAPDVATPIDAIAYPTLVTADQNGMAVLAITASDPGNPRGYIDGQVYGLRPVLEDTVFSPGSPYPYNPSDFISVLVWDDFWPDEDPVTWYGTLQPVLQQFENLYPVMERFVLLGDYESVCANARDLTYAFSLDPDNPNFMPVTRDLSPAKRATLLRWLREPGPDGLPLEGTPPPGARLPAPPALAAAPPAPAAEGLAAAPALAQPGPEAHGKAAAASRRLANTLPATIAPGTPLGGLE